MRKLKLQMQLSVDGFVAGPGGEMDWMVWNWDESLKEHVNALTNPVDCIVLGRVLAEGFIAAWADRAAEPEADAFTRKMNDLPKVVFSRTLQKSKWKDVMLVNGDLADGMRRLKAAPGGDIIAYGGATFVSELIRERLIDEFHLFVNPAALGSGMTIFRESATSVPLKLVSATPFDCGIVALAYALGPS